MCMLVLQQNTNQTVLQQNRTEQCYNIIPTKQCYNRTEQNRTVLQQNTKKRHKKGPRGHQRGNLAERMGYNK